MIVDQITYQKAFQSYLRKGIPIERLLKQQPPTTHYTWRTRGDGKVRSSHAANDGRVFAWDNPPATGHPGEDYGCRCVAEPYYAAIEEKIIISLSGISDHRAPWRNQDYVDHYFLGNGQDVTLSQIGQLRNISEAFDTLRGEALKQQLASEARKIRNGVVTYHFENAYDLTSVSFSIGDTVIGGKFSGHCQEQHGALVLNGSLDFYLRDEFADPLDVGIEVFDIPEMVEDFFSDLIDQRLQGMLQQRKERVRYGTPYSIAGKWNAVVTGQFYRDPSKSHY